MPSRPELTPGQPTQSQKRPEDMNLEELTAVLEAELDEATKLVGPAEQPQEQPTAGQAPPSADLLGLTPALIQEATSLLVQMGLMDAATAALSPELIAKLQAMAETFAPGLFDLTIPDQMEEFLNGIVNGTIDAGGPYNCRDRVDSGGGE